MLCRNPECRAEVNPEALFCGKCGTPVMSNCLVCNAAIPAKRNAKCCPQCGTMIAEMKSKMKPRAEYHAPSTASAPARTERETVRPAESVRAVPADSPARPHSETVSVSTERPDTVSASRPAEQLKTDRSLGMFIVLTLVTFGIYSIVFHTKIGNDINTIASKHDGQKTMHFCLVFFLLAPITFYLALFFWFANVAGRVGAEQVRRGYPRTIGRETFWTWGLMGSLLFGIGPMVFIHKLSTAMNTLATDYNARG